MSVPPNEETKCNTLSNPVDPHQSLPATLPPHHDLPIYKKSLIGKAVFIKGHMTAREDMIIHGRVEGTITIKNNLLEIGSDGRIEANAFAKTIIIDGELKGDVYASQQVIVKKSARVFGNIYSSNVSIEDGALLKGIIDMERQDAHAPNKHDLFEDIQDENHAKAASFSAIFKRVQEIAHLNANHHGLENKNDVEALLSDNMAKDIAFGAIDNRVNQEDPGSTHSVIGETVLIKGEIISEEDVTLLGEFDGTIYFKEHNLEVGPHAHIKANTFVKSIISQGDIKGDIYASEHIVIKKAGHVLGKLLSPRISIESGATVKSNIQMDQQDIEKIFSSITSSSAHKENATAAKKSETKANANLSAGKKSPSLNNRKGSDVLAAEKFQSLLTPSE